MIQHARRLLWLIQRLAGAAWRFAQFPIARRLLSPFIGGDVFVVPRLAMMGELARLVAAV